MVTVITCDKQRFKWALITKWQLTTIVSMCFTVYKALLNSLLSHLNKFPILFIPEEEHTQVPRNPSVRAHSSLFCVASAKLTYSPLRDKASDQYIDKVIGAVSIDPKSWAGNP